MAKARRFGDGFDFRVLFACMVVLELQHLVRCDLLLSSFRYLARQLPGGAKWVSEESF